ncbi:MAG: hypothetical protein H0X64_04805 [Gemmatimonadaceae bacterium]|nr:hypothetical protein [Gemmatimonadaceae bacterium]
MGDRVTAGTGVSDVLRHLSRLPADGILGLGVSVDAVRAVRLRGAAIRWSGEIAITELLPLAAVVDRLIGDAITHAGRPRMVVAAVGPQGAQLRRLTGLPAVPPRLVASLVRENASRFFLRNGAPIVTTEVDRAEEGVFWGAAIEEPIVIALRGACAKHRLRLSAVVPSAIVLAYAAEADIITWLDGDVAGSSQFAARRIVAYRRHEPTTSSAEPPAQSDMAPPLRQLGAAGWRLADAYAAAIVGRNATIAWRPGAARHGATPGGLATRLLSGALCAAAIAAATVAPGLAAVQQERAAARELDALQSRAVETHALQAKLVPLVRDVAAINEFAAGARSMTLVLAGLTSLVEPPASVAALRLDSAGGTMTVVAPSAASVLQQLEATDMIGGLTIVGPVVPIVAPNQPPVGMPVPGMTASSRVPRSERVTIRFQWGAMKGKAAP